MLRPAPSYKAGLPSTSILDAGGGLL